MPYPALENVPNSVVHGNVGSHARRCPRKLEQFSVRALNADRSRQIVRRHLLLSPFVVSKVQALVALTVDGARARRGLLRTIRQHFHPVRALHLDVRVLHGQTGEVTDIVALSGKPDQEDQLKYEHDRSKRSPAAEWASVVPHFELVRSRLLPGLESHRSNESGRIDPTGERGGLEIKF